MDYWAAIQSRNPKKSAIKAFKQKLGTQATLWRARLLALSLRDFSEWLSAKLLLYQEAMMALVQGYRETTLDDSHVFPDGTSVKQRVEQFEERWRELGAARDAVLEEQGQKAKALWEGARGGGGGREGQSNEK